MPTQRKSILALAFEAGIHPFDIVPSGLTLRQLGDHASRMLQNRNPYFDAEYRDRFGTRVHTIQVSPSRLAMGCVESAQPEGSDDRVFRAVVFRCDGFVIYQTPDDRLLGQYEANVDLTYRLQHCDEAGMLETLCKSRIKKGERMAMLAQLVLDQLKERSPPKVT